MAPEPHPACLTARMEVFGLRHIEPRNDGSSKSFFPLDKLRSYFTRKKVQEILKCSCQKCRNDCSATDPHANPVNNLGDIIGEGGDPKDTSRTAFSLLGLLTISEHPLFIIGFLAEERTDQSLEYYQDFFNEDELRKITGSYATNDEVGFVQFATQFAMYMPQFAVRHMNSGKFSKYPTGTILPFINEQEIGQQMDQSGHLTNIGANGRVFAFEIYEEYRKFPHAIGVRKFARKRVETTKFTAHLEKANLQNVQSYNDKHIVKLIKAYSIGGIVNLIFPLAKTNLDQLLRNSAWEYASSRGGLIGECNAWIQLLGVSKALAKIAGVPSEVTPSSLTRDTSWHWYGFHFDLKPANILISEDGTWLITDFGQATFTYSSDRTPRVADKGGTDAYAPPEIDNINQEFSRRYDVWSLGCIILEVTAFIVLGYEGLKGCAEYEGLDEVRREHDGWSRRVDDRFFYRIERNGEYKVKGKILNFMEFLKERVRNRDQHSEKFLTDILDMVQMMIEPDLEKRFDIGDVIRVLDTAIIQAASADQGGQPRQAIAAPGEIDIGGPQLSLIKMYHWSQASRVWQQTSLQVFEDLNGNIRLYTLAVNRASAEMYMRRQRDEILPRYAFWERERPQANEPWLCFATIDATGVSEMPGAIYGFTGINALADARTIQSKLTYQKIEMSFSLHSVKVKRYRQIAKKVWASVSNGVSNVMGHKHSNSEAFEEKLIEGRSLGPATVQLWTEQVDLAVAKRKESQSISAESHSKRKPRLQPHQQPGYRDIRPRRVVIYLHDHGCILTVKTADNWIVRPVQDNPKALNLKPTDKGRDPRFVMSLIQPSRRHTAGLPLCPQVLRSVESSHRFEADFVELDFAANNGPTEFNEKYRKMKHTWDIETEEVRRQQGFTPVDTLPYRYPEPLNAPAKGKEIGKIQRQSQSQVLSQPPEPFSQEYYASTLLPPVGKGKEKVSETPLVYGNGVHSGNLLSPNHQTYPDSTATLQHTPRNQIEHLHPPKPTLTHGGGGRGRPPKPWKKNTSSTDTSSSNTSQKDSMRYA